MLSLTSRRGGTAVAALLLLGLAACTGDDEAGTAATASPTPTSEARIETLSGEQTAVTLDPGFLEGLSALQVTPAAVGGASLEPATGVLSVPITGGSITYAEPESGAEPDVQGVINHDGSGLQLTGPTGAAVALEELEVDLAGSTVYGRVTADGEVRAERADLFHLDRSTRDPLQVDEDAGTAVLRGSTLSLTGTAAEVLNTAFGTSALAERVLVGAAEVTLALPEPPS
jgi:hypothetical protein